VVIDRRYDDLDTLSVCLDDRGGGYKAAQYLLKNGHRKIAFAAPSIYESSVIRDRFEGYRAALGEYGLKEREEWLFDNVALQAGGESVAESISRMNDRPTAVVATEDLLACGIPRGAEIVSVNEDSPAEEAGLQEKDIIIGANGEEVKSSDDLVKIVSACEHGEKLELTVYRAGEKVDITVTVGENVKSALPETEEDQKESE
jgi:S1-C subfamily serine protease